MNSTPDSNLSLYESIKNSNSSLITVDISPDTLQSYVEMMSEVLTAQEAQITIVIKPPQFQKSWTKITQQYQQQSNLKSLYLCGDFSDSSSRELANTTLSSTKIIPIILGKDSRLKRECFFVAISSNFCGLILAQWQKGKVQVNRLGKRLQQPYLETIVSFDPLLIRQFLAEINSIIAQNNSDVRLETIDFNDNTFSRQTQLLNNLLIKQIAKEDSLTNGTNRHNLTDTEDRAISLASTLGLQTDFLRNLVEEMRSPITHMKTTISLLESKQIKGEQRQRYFQMLEKQCDRQTSVISGLIELLQLDVSTEANNIYLNEFVPGIVSTYQPLALENNIQLGYTIPANLPPVIFPALWLRQIVIQLLNNSLQFTPPEGKVFVQAGFKSPHVELTIEDTGRGIDSLELNKIFDSFYRTRTISNDSTMGAGLGLTIVRQLVRQSGGKISVTSKLNKGSNFKILLPALPPELIE